MVAAVLSGNRNFEGRIHPLARASYLASPPLVVAFALAGTRRHRPARPSRSAPAATASRSILADIWPAPEEIRAAIRESVDPDMFRRIYASVFDGDDRWRALPVPARRPLRLGRGVDLRRAAAVLRWPHREPAPVADIEGARVLAVLGDSVTTDHISPAGSIPAWSPAGQWLQEHGVGAARLQLATARVAAITR